jgi:hypothetical protein
MPTYFVTLNRPEVVAADPQEAMDKCLADPLGPKDTFFVKEVPPDGSVYYAAGGMATIGGSYLTPETIVEGPTVKE